jgi:hypothetical protein
MWQCCETYFPSRSCSELECKMFGRSSRLLSLCTDFLVPRGVSGFHACAAPRALGAASVSTPVAFFRPAARKVGIFHSGPQHSSGVMVCILVHVKSRSLVDSNLVFPRLVAPCRAAGPFTPAVRNLTPETRVHALIFIAIQAVMTIVFCSTSGKPTAGPI